MGSLVLLDPEGDALGQSLLALKGSLEVQQRSTGDVLSILEKVDDRLASLERHMAPIRRVTEQLTTAERNVIGSYDAMKKVHENFRVLSEADTVLRKGLHHTHHHHNPRPSGAGDNDDGHDDEGREHEQHHPEEEEVEPAGGEHLEHAGEETASLAAYLETVDRVQEALRFLRRNPRMRSAEVASRQLELKQQKLLADMRAEAHRVLASRSRCALAYVPVAGGGMDYQAGDPIPPSAARRVRALVDALLRAGDTRWAEQAYVKARRAKLEGALRPFLEQQRQVLMGGKGAGGLERERAVSGFFSGGEDALGVTGTVGRGSVAMGAGAMMSVRVASSTAGAGAEGEWVRYLQFLRELVKAEDTLYQRALPASHHQHACAAAHLELLSPVVAKACSEASEALDALVARERSRPGEKALLLLALVRGAKKEMPALERLLKGLAAAAGAGAAGGGGSSGGSRPVSMALTAAASAVLGGGGTAPWEQVTRLYQALCRLAISALATLAEEVANDPSAVSARNLPPSATVHVVTSNTLRTFKRLMAHEEAFTELATLGLAPALPWESPDDHDDDAEEEEDEDGANRHLRAYAAHLFMSLLKNLRAKADAYARLGEGGVDALSQAGRPHLFLMNNAHYMITTVRGSSAAAAAAAASQAGDDLLANLRSGSSVTGTSPRPTAGATGGSSLSMKRGGSVPIATALSEALLDRLAAVVADSRARFLATVWGALAQETKDLSLPLEFQKAVVPGQAPQLTFESGRLIKARFAAFNERLEALYPCQKAFAVPDAALRQRLREEAKAAVLPGYAAFFEKYGAMQFSKKHMDGYLRFPPTTVASMIDELYSG